MLRGAALSELPVIENAFVLIEDGIIAEYGPMYELELKVPQLPKETIDAQGGFVLPAWCDSHTHLVFAASREEEFIDKLKGMSYADIAAKGGGILNSARKLNETSEDELFNDEECLAKADPPAGNPCWGGGRDAQRSKSEAKKLEAGRKWRGPTCLE